MTGQIDPLDRSLINLLQDDLPLVPHPFAALGKLKPLISGSYPLAEGGAAIRHIADRKAMGKIVIEPHK